MCPALAHCHLQTEFMHALDTDMDGTLSRHGACIDIGGTLTQA